MKTHKIAAQSRITPYMQDERLATIDALLHRSGLSEDQRQRLEQLHALIVKEVGLRQSAPGEARRLDTRIRWIERGAPVNPLPKG